MARFKVYGAHKETGDDAAFTCECESPDEAEAIASVRGVMVSRVVEVELSERSPDRVQVIEQTGKQHKAAIAIAALAAIVFATATMVALTQGSGSVKFFALGFVVSLFAFIFARAAAWWDHG